MQNIEKKVPYFVHVFPDNLCPTVFLGVGWGGPGGSLTSSNVNRKPTSSTISFSRSKQSFRRVRSQIIRICTKSAQSGDNIAKNDVVRRRYTVRSSLLRRNSVDDICKLDEHGITVVRLEKLESYSRHGNINDCSHSAREHFAKIGITFTG